MAAQTEAAGIAATATVRRFFELFTVDGWREAVKLCAPGAQWEVAPRTVSSGVESLEAHMTYLRDVLADYSRFRIECFDLVAAPDGKVVYCSAKSDCDHKYLGAYGQDYVFMLRLNESGEITYVREFVDSFYSVKFFTKAEKAKKQQSKL